MRIGIDSRELHGRPTGVGRYLAELLARWTRDVTLRSHELLLFSPAAPAAGDTLDLGWLGDTGARAAPVAVPGAGGTRWEQTSLARAANAARLDAFFAPGYTAPLACRAPIVVAVHDVSFAAHPEWYRPREGLRRRWLTRLAVRRAERVLTLSAFSRAELQRWTKVPDERIDVIPLAADRHPALAGPQPAASARDPLVLYLGTILARRHVPLLIRAFARTLERVPAARLEVVGENRSWPPVDLDAALATVPGAAARVRVRAYVDDATVAELLARARLLVFLSAYEGFGLTPLEAMAAGVPPLVLDTEVAREVYGDAASYTVRDERAVADAMTVLLTDDRARGDLVAHGRERLALYSWDRTARRTMDAIVDASRRAAEARSGSVR